MKYSKWIPLKAYVSSGTVRLIMARKNIKTGMIYFRVKHIAGRFAYCQEVPTLNMNEQFNKLLA